MPQPQETPRSPENSGGSSDPNMAFRFALLSAGLGLLFTILGLVFENDSVLTVGITTATGGGLGAIVARKPR